jgi:hypothetical protein
VEDHTVAHTGDDPPGDIHPHQPGSPGPDALQRFSIGGIYVNARLGGGQRCVAGQGWTPVHAYNLSVLIL